MILRDYDKHLRIKGLHHDSEELTKFVERYLCSDSLPSLLSELISEIYEIQVCIDGLIEDMEYVEPRCQ